MAGKVAVVTSGSRGIATATGKGLIADGASVAFTYAKGANATALVLKEIEPRGGKAIAIQADAGAKLTGDVALPLSSIRARITNPPRRTRKLRGGRSVRSVKKA